MKLNQYKARKQLANDCRIKCRECGRNNFDHSYADFFRCEQAHFPPKPKPWSEDPDRASTMADWIAEHPSPQAPVTFIDHEQGWTIHATVDSIERAR